MRGATTALVRASQQNADLITQLQRKVEEQQAAAQQENVLEVDESPWKAKYEEKVAEVERLEQENWELQDKMQDALEHIDLLKRTLRNSITIELQGELMDTEFTEAELPFETYEKEWRSLLRDRRQG
jgi:lipid II:glycine glycyltransferase (peptidoglycan interpeptide bridge formation enzyme)